MTDTIVVDTGDRQAVVGLQTDGVQEGSRVEVQVLATYPDTWTLAGLGDVNGDASGDLVWKDESGQMRVLASRRDLLHREEHAACARCSRIRGGLPGLRR